MDLSPQRKWSLLALLAGGLLLFLQPAGWAQEGGNPCGACHEDQVRAFQGTLHEAFMARAEGRNGCEACHGDGKAHMEDPSPTNIRGKEALAKWTAREEAEACLSCHGEVYRDKRATLNGVHVSAGVSCWDCHGEALHFVRDGGPATPRPTPATASPRNPSERCLKCHDGQRVDFALPYRHPVDRAQVRCWDCHEPHGADRVLSPNPEEASAPCLSCHPQARGPFVWRHLALDDQGCGSCHRPHGSVNPRLLLEAGNGLCLKCHYEQNFPQIGTTGHRFKLQRHARCLDCHTAAHGSNVSDKLLR
ncbi:MAG: cytochrome c3 family protein [Acidobacteriota bacterium]